MEAAQRVHGFGDTVELHRERLVAPGIVEHVATIRGQREIHAEPLGGIRENANLVAGGGGEEEQSLGH